ncbi:MAG: peptidoglycan DD-metalloendopeptidase family protein [Candidatus Geothermincolia bacterium]
MTAAAAIVACSLIFSLAIGLPGVRCAPGGSRTTARDWGTCSSGATSPSCTWFLAEGCTDGGLETWILVQNPQVEPVTVTLEFQTGTGYVEGPADIIPAKSRRTFDVSDYVVSYDVSTTVRASAGVVCERSVYGAGRRWATTAGGTAAPTNRWYLAEGCTAGGIETWVLVQNPSPIDASVNMTFQTENGVVQGPRETLPPYTRRSYDLSRYVVSYNVATEIYACSGVVCERAMYGNGRAWGTCSSAVEKPATDWYLAEGCTAAGFETWLLVQNPGSEPAGVSTRLITSDGEVAGPGGIVPAGSRRSFRINDDGSFAGVGTVLSSSAPVVVERAMYGGERSWGSTSNGCDALSSTWYLPEGCTERGFETWLALLNPGDHDVDFTVTLQTEKGESAGPAGTIEPGQRLTFDLGSRATTYNLSTRVDASGPIACERSIYGDSADRMLRAPVDGPPLYPFTPDESIACGHWPAGSTDYPYFGAPRNGTRLHAGIDIYPAAGEGAPVMALKAGTVIKTGLFYTRYTGEETFAVLVDHGDFVANYAEVRPPGDWVQPGAPVAPGQVLGYVSGTAQLHFEMYTPGTTSWLSWYGPQPSNLLDPTATILPLY